MLIAQGDHPKVIHKRLGHAKTTLDTYGHLFDGLDEAAATRLDVSWRGLLVRTECGRNEPATLCRFLVDSRKPLRQHRGSGESGPTWI